MGQSTVFLLHLTVLFLNYPTSKATELIVSSIHDKAVELTPCIDNSDCSIFQNATCVDDFCQCNGSTKFCKDKPEIKVSKLGNKCQIDADCNIEHSTCENQLCKCDKGRVGSTDGRKCLKVADGLGSTCEDGVQCYTKVPQSGCQNEKCVCQQQTHEFDGKCYNDTELGGKCEHLGDCTKTLFARCMEEECTCKNGYVPNGASNRCLEIARRINDPCYEDIQCSHKFGKAVCKQGFCQCDELYQFKKAMGICVRDLLLGDVCEKHTDCHGIEEGESRLECILGECKCKSEYVEVLGFCTSAVSPFFQVSSVLLTIGVCLSIYFSNAIFV